MCCRNIDRYVRNVYPKLKALLGDRIGEFTIEAHNGTCIHLTPDNKCNIYNNRPIICNSQIIFSLLSKTYGVPMEELYKLQNLSCKINNTKY